jgi:hypothetical protein
MVCGGQQQSRVDKSVYRTRHHIRNQKRKSRWLGHEKRMPEEKTAKKGKGLLESQERDG